jgi:hypothetical protein
VKSRLEEVPGDPFDAVRDLVGVFPEDLVGVGSTEISADCRKLLFVGVTVESAYLLYQATR